MRNRPASGRGGPSLFAADSWQKVAASLDLAPQEVMIARGILADQTEAQIAHRLALNPHVVHDKVKRLYKRFGLHSRVQLMVRLAAEHFACRDEATQADSAEPATAGDDWPVFGEPGWRRLAETLKLSEKQMEAARAVVRDESERKTARRLGVSIHAVNKRIRHLYKTLHIYSRVDLVGRLIEEHILHEGH